MRNQRDLNPIDLLMGRFFPFSVVLFGPATSFDLLSPPSPMRYPRVIHDVWVMGTELNVQICRYLGPGYPLLLCLGKRFVVLLNYALMAEQPDPCGPEPYSPGKQLRTRSPLGKGPVAPRIPG